MVCDEIFLIDGSAYIYRAYHAIAPLNNSRGLPTHAVYGFTTILRRIIRERNPECIAIAFDTKGPVFRHTLYPEYKANRPPMPDDLAVQIPYIKRIAESYNILSLEHKDQEADDLIASAAKKLVAQGCRVVIVSGDKDLLQLVSDSVSMWDPMSDRVMTTETVEKKYGIGPEQLLDFFSLTGDSSDNIPGVPGIGPKTAEKLIKQYSTLEGLYSQIDSIKASKMKERLIDHKDDAFLSRKLIRLNQEAEVPASPDQYKLQEPQSDKLRELLTELEFHTLLKSDAPASKVDTLGFALVKNRKQLDEVARQLAKAVHIVIDTETTSLDPIKAQLVGISICVDTEKAWYIPCGHRDRNHNLVADQLPLAEIMEVLRPFLEDKKLPKIGHNLKYDWAVLAAPQNEGLRLNGPLYDTMVGAWLLDPGRRSYKLDDLCLDLDIQLTSFSEVVGGDKREDSFSKVGLEQARDYSCEDVYASLRLFEQQQEGLKKFGLWGLFADLECPLIPVLAEMEGAGVKVDATILDELSIEFGYKIKDLEQEIHALAGQDFNINSPQQLSEILFDKLNLPKGRKTKTGYSTDVKVLEKLSQQHELPRLILDYRNLAKLKSTYVDKLTTMVNEVTGRVHTSFNQCGTATGRLSSSNPNLQNIPIRTEDGQRIRSAFVAAEGYSLVSADYSQVDLRVLAHYSGDAALREAFLKGGDIHQQTAAEIFLVAKQLITPEMRRVAKTINFGIVYGMSSFGLSTQLNISRKEAQVFIDRYFSHYSGVKSFMESIVEQAKQDGYVATLLGRRRLLPDINHTNRTRREFAERTAINTPIQGTAADIIKLAMLQVSRELARQRLEAKMILQIHDELVLEAPDEEIDQVKKLLKNAMENVINLDVPLVANLSVSADLAKI